MTTIHDVAHAASVSISTVSRVVNGDPTVHPALRRQVEEAVQQLGYRPNAAARSLRRTRTETIAAVITDLPNPVFTEMIHGIESVARHRHVNLFLCDSRGSLRIQRAHVESLAERRVDGVIINAVGDHQQELAPLIEGGIPLVIISRRAPGTGFAELIVDEQDASVAAFQSLLDLGHRRIGLVMHRFRAPASGPVTSPHARIAAYRQAHALAGTPVDESLIVTPLTINEVYASTVALLSRADRPTALVVGAHPFLADCLLAVQRVGLRIPDDLSLIAYGDSRWTEVHQPPISVIRMDYIEYGRRAAELLFAVGADAATDRSLFQRAELVMRDSCAPAPGARRG
ncbi:MAG: LacI family DNA-binding transcriptional regulator [Dehalococcoidia bacterium]